MIVLAWFTLMGLIILFGFAFVGVTFVHWYRQRKLRRKAALMASAGHSTESVKNT